MQNVDSSLEKVNLIQTVYYQSNITLLETRGQKLWEAPRKCLRPNP